MIKNPRGGRFWATQDELQMIFDRSMSLRLAERNRIETPPAADDKVKKTVEDAEKNARTKWRDATDKILKKPP